MLTDLSCKPSIDPEDSRKGELMSRRKHLAIALEIYYLHPTPPPQLADDWSLRQRELHLLGKMNGIFHLWFYLFLNVHFWIKNQNYMDRYTQEVLLPLSSPFRPPPPPTYNPPLQLVILSVFLFTNINNHVPIFLTLPRYTKDSTLYTSWVLFVRFLTWQYVL